MVRARVELHQMEDFSQVGDFVTTRILVVEENEEKYLDGKMVFRSRARFGFWLLYGCSDRGCGVCYGLWPITVAVAGKMEVQ